MPARNSGESLYNYCNRLINSNIQSDINWGKQLLSEWNYNKNRIKPENYKKFSNKKVWWKCKTCGHSWQATILNRTYNRSGCPNCAGRV